MKQNGVRLVQRKFAQGVPLPVSSASAAPAPPDRKPEPAYTPKNVYHNNMSARSLLDIVSMQNIHKHKQEPLVVLERLREDEIPPPAPTVRSARVPRIRVPLRRRKMANGNMCLRSGKRKSTDAAKGPIKKRKKLSSESTDDIPLVYYFNNKPAKALHGPIRPKPITDKKEKTSERTEREKRKPTPKRSERLDTTVAEKPPSRAESRASDDRSFTFKEPTSPARLSYRVYKKIAAANTDRQLKKSAAKEARWSSLRSARAPSETRGIVRRLRSKVLLGKKPPKPAVRKAGPKTSKDGTPTSPPALSSPPPSGFRIPRPPISESSYAPSEQDSLDSFRLSLHVAESSKPGSSGTRDSKPPSTVNTSRRESLESIARFLACKEEGSQESWASGVVDAAPPATVLPSAVTSFSSVARNDEDSIRDDTSLSDYYSDIIKLGPPPPPTEEVNDTQPQPEPKADLEKKVENASVEPIRQKLDEKNPKQETNKNDRNTEQNVIQNKKNKNLKKLDNAKKTDKSDKLNETKRAKGKGVGKRTVPKDAKGKKPTKVTQCTQKPEAPKEPKKTLPKRASKTAAPQEEPSTLAPSTRLLRNSREPPPAANPDVYEFDAELEASRPPSGLRRRDPTPSLSQPNPTQPNPTQPNPTQPNPTQPNPTQPDPTQPNPTQPDPTQPDPTQPNPTQAKTTDAVKYMDIIPASSHLVIITSKTEGKELISASLVPKDDIYKKQRNLIDNLTNSPALLNKLFNCLPTELQDELGNLATTSGGREEAYLEEKAGSVLEAPTFYPTAEEFQDPIKYYDKIAPEASKYGLCKIVPPADFKPVCTMSDSIRFAVIYQYISKMYSRWGPVSRELAAIKAHLRTQSVVFARSPLLDGSEVNLPKLYHAVERNGGLSNVIQRKRWGRVADEMKLTKLQHPERKLDPIYMRYLLPYATLSDQERQSIMAEVEKCWTTKYQKMLERARNPFQRQNRMLGAECESESDDEAEDSNTAGALHEAEDCIVQGRTMNLLTFKKIATSLMDAHFEPGKQPPGAVDVEKAYWRAVLLGTDHIVANTASIDTGEEGYGFPKDPQAEYGTHPWNLKVLARNPNNVLRYLGPVLGVTVPTLHLNMLFSTSCWHRDPHGLPWTEYMHGGAEKIWYGIPRDESANFRRAVETLCPAYCQNKSIWLASEITMVPPNILSEHGVKLSRLLQRPGEYVMVFPEAHSCSITTGFGISESVYFASNAWLSDVYKLFQELRNSCEPTMFSLEQLLLNGSAEPEAPPRVSAVLATLLAAELEHRRALERRGLKVLERPPPTAPLNTSYFRAWHSRDQDECEYCRSTLFLSKVTGLTGRKSAVCPEHALRLLETKKYKNVDLQTIEFLSSYTTLALEEMAERLEGRTAERSRASSVVDLAEPERPNAE